jgi:transposase-like protein
MRYAASEKLEIIRLVEEGHLSARQTLAKLGIPRTTFYRWYDRYLQRGEAGLQDQSPKPKHVWNRIPDEVRRKVVKLALKETELSPRELAVTFTDQESYFVSEASTYRILKAHDLITSPAFIVIKAASEFKDKTTAINQLWQTDFTYLKVLGWPKPQHNCRHVPCQHFQNARGRSGGRLQKEIIALDAKKNASGPSLPDSDGCGHSPSLLSEKVCPKGVAVKTPASPALPSSQRRLAKLSGRHSYTVTLFTAIFRFSVVEVVKAGVFTATTPQRGSYSPTPTRDSFPTWARKSR